MALTVGQLVAYLSAEGAAQAARDVTGFQQSVKTAGTEAQTAAGKVDKADQSTAKLGGTAVKTAGPLKDTSGALIGVTTAAGRTTKSMDDLDSAGRKVNETSAKSEAASARLTAAQARLTDAEDKLAKVRSDQTATASQVASAEARVATQKAAVVTASNRATTAAESEAAAQANLAEAVSASAAAQSEGADAANESADAAADVTEGASDASDSIETLGATASASGAAILGAFGAAQVMFSNFDAQMSSTGAAVSDLADDDLQRLRQAALDAGAATFFSATEAAAGEEALAKAGVGVSDIVNGALTGALNLAASGNLDVADSAETAATAMTVFGLKGAQVPHVADVLAAAAGKAQGEVSDMAQALNQSALVAHGAGLTFEDTSGALALFAANGLIGSDAGTSFKTMLMSLNPRSKEAAGLIDDLGISAYDSQGNFIGLAEYAELLHERLAPLPTDQRNMALQTIFGTDAIRAANIVMDAGATGVNNWRDAVNDAGYAQQQASAKMDNLKGDVEQLSGAFQTLVLSNSSGVNGFLREIVQHATNNVNALGQLPPVVGQVGSTLGIAGGAMALFGGASMLLKGRLDNVAFAMMDVATRPGARFTGAMGAASSGVSFLSRNLLGITAVVGIAVLAFDHWSQQQAKNKAQTDQLASSLDAATGAVTANTREIVAKALADAHAYDNAQKLGLSATVVTDAALGQADAMAKVKAATDAATSTLDTSGNAMGRYAAVTGDNQKQSSDLDGVARSLNDTLSGQNDRLGNATTQWRAVNDATQAGAEAAKEASDKQNDASTALDGTTVSMQGQTDAATVLKNALDNLSGKDISEAQAQLGLNAAMNGFTAAVEQNGASLTATRTVRDAAGNEFQVLADGATKNQQALIGAIQQINTHAEAVYKQTGSIDAVNSTIQMNTDQLRAAAQAAGLNADEVQALIDKYAATPQEVSTNVYANTAQAQANVSELKRWLDLLQDRTITINYDVVARYSQGLDYYGNPIPKARGGLITGPGTGTSDEAGVYALSNREFVLTAAAVNKVGVPYLEALNDGAEPLQALGAGRGAASSSGGGATAAGVGRKVEITNYLSGWERREVALYNEMQIGPDY